MLFPWLWFRALIYPAVIPVFSLQLHCLGSLIVHYYICHIIKFNTIIVDHTLLQPIIKYYEYDFFYFMNKGLMDLKIRTVKVW